MPVPTPPPSAGPATTYAERLAVPLRWWVQGVMLLATFWLAFVAAIPGVVPWLLTGVLLVLLVTLLVSYGSARVDVADGELRAGPARIAVGLLGPAVPLDAVATRATAGSDADARAFLLLRPYLKRAVRVDVADPADPTPYWLVSTRHPDTLAATLNHLSGRGARG